MTDDESPQAPSGDAAAAAERLRHDLGKAIRLSAPDVPERSTEALRARLRADVLETRRDSTGARPATDLFDRWWRASARLFPEGGELRRRTDRIARTIEAIRGLAASLERLSRPDLERLDRLTEDVARECRELATAARRPGARA
ncbi:MAG: hypothetical protein ACM3NW_10760 [Syntrophomonadaceae bacterium]